MKRAERTSYFYLLVAFGCFDRARQSRHRATLCSIGRNYLSKAVDARVPAIDPPARAVSQGDDQLRKSRMLAAIS